MLTDAVSGGERLRASSALSSIRPRGELRNGLRFRFPGDLERRRPWRGDGLPPLADPRAHGRARERARLPWRAGLPRTAPGALPLLNPLPFGGPWRGGERAVSRPAQRA